MFRFLVLGLLRSGAAQHGYALIKEYRARSGVAMTTGNFYRELHRLVGAGLVRTVTNPEGADSRRAPYAITESGTRAFDSWLSTPRMPPIGQSGDYMSARALFVGEAGPAVTRTLLDRWRDELWLRGKLLERDQEIAVRQRTGGQFDALTMLLTRRLKHIAADLEFIEEFRVVYEAWLVRQGGATPSVRPVVAARTAKRRSRRPAKRSRKRDVKLVKEFGFSHNPVTATPTITRPSR